MDYGTSKSQSKEQYINIIFTSTLQAPNDMTTLHKINMRRCAHGPALVPLDLRMDGLTAGDASGAVATMPDTRAASRAARFIGLLGVGVSALLSDARSDAGGAGASVTSATTGGMGLALIKAARSSPSAFSPSVSHISMLAAILSVSCVPAAPRKCPHSSKYGFIKILRERRRAKEMRRVRPRAHAWERGARVGRCRGAG